MVDFYSFLKVGSFGLVHLLFKNKIARKRLIKQINKIDLSSIENIEKILTLIDKLIPLFKKKKNVKYIEKMGGLDLDKSLFVYLKNRGINKEKIIEEYKNLKSKMGSNKLEQLMKVIDETDNITVLKQQMTKKTLTGLRDYVDNMITLIEKDMEEYQTDLKTNIRKKLEEKTDVINEADKLKIEQEAIQNFSSFIKIKPENKPKTVEQKKPINPVIKKRNK